MVLPVFIFPCSFSKLDIVTSLPLSSALLMLSQLTSLIPSPPTLPSSPPSQCLPLCTPWIFISAIFSFYMFSLSGFINSLLIVAILESAVLISLRSSKLLLVIPIYHKHSELIMPPNRTHCCPNLFLLDCGYLFFFFL